MNIITAHKYSANTTNWRWVLSI